MTGPDPVPPQAITAAIASLGKYHDVNLWLTAAEGTVGGLLARKDILTRAVVAAAPHLAAAERERVLAEVKDALLAERAATRFWSGDAFAARESVLEGVAVRVGCGLLPPFDMEDLLRGGGEGSGT